MGEHRGLQLPLCVHALARSKMAQGTESVVRGQCLNPEMPYRGEQPHTAAVYILVIVATSEFDNEFHIKIPMTLILDTDPGTDDMLALLYLLAVDPQQEKLRAITLTFGNTSLENTLRNALSLFNVLVEENKARASESHAPFTCQRPAIHLGEQGPLSHESSSTTDSDHFQGEQTKEDAEDVHGSDGLGGIHDTNPEFDAPAEWFDYFPRIENGRRIQNNGLKVPQNLPFIPGQTPSWKAVLDILAEEPEDTVTIVAVGPMTNLAKAAQHDIKTFLRVKQVLSMGAALSIPGNVTPTAEFNVFADPLASAQIYALTSKHPEVTMPHGFPMESLKDVHKQLELVLFPLDITQQHTLHLSDVEREVGDFAKSNPKSTLAQWVNVWLVKSFSNYGKLIGVGPDIAVMNLHDPLTAAYAIEGVNDPHWKLKTCDARVEVRGQWTLGMTVIDARGRAKGDDNPHDKGKWLTKDQGNEVRVLVDTPIKETFGPNILKLISRYN